MSICAMFPSPCCGFGGGGFGAMVATDHFDGSNQDVLKPIVRYAATRNGKLAAPLFKTSDFMQAVREGFGVKASQPLQWGRDVLAGLDYVATAGGPDNWISLLASRD